MKGFSGIKELQKYSQQHIASELSVTRQAVNLWFKGRQKPSLKNFLQLAEKFSVNLQVLVECFVE